MRLGTKKSGLLSIVCRALDVVKTEVTTEVTPQRTIWDNHEFILRPTIRLITREVLYFQFSWFGTTGDGDWCDLGRPL